MDVKVSTALRIGAAGEQPVTARNTLTGGIGIVDQAGDVAIQVAKSAHAPMHRSTGGSLHSVVDVAGRRALAINNEGHLVAKLATESVGDVADAVADAAADAWRGSADSVYSAGNIATGIVVDNAWTGRAAQLVDGLYDTAVACSGILHGIHWTGQSNASSAGTSTAETVAQKHPHHALYFNTGRATTGESAPVTGSAITDFVPVQTVSDVASNAYTLQAIAAEKLARNFGEQGFASLARSDYHGGQPISYISPGSNAYTNLITSLTRAPIVAAKYGMSYKPSVFIDHGESGPHGRTTYATALTSLINSIKSDGKTASGQTPDVYVWQCSFYGGDSETSRDAVDLAQSDVCAAMLGQGVYLLGPTYPYRLSSDAIHHSSLGRMSQAEVAAYVHRRARIDGRWQPLKPHSVKLTGSTIVVDFVNPCPDMPVQFDADWVEATDNYGFAYSDSTTSATISAVTRTGPSQITVALSGTPSGSSKKLTYAMTADAPTDPAWMIQRGQVYVSSGVRSPFADAGHSVPADIRLYCIAFSEAL